MELRRRYVLHLDSHGEAANTFTLPFARLNVFRYESHAGRPLIVANATSLPWQFAADQLAAARLFPGHDVAFLSLQNGFGAPVLFWFGTVTEQGEVVERRTPGHSLVGSLWYMLGRDLLPAATLPRIQLHGCGRLAARGALALTVYGDMRAVTVPEGGGGEEEAEAEDAEIATVGQPRLRCGCATHFDVHAFAGALGIRWGDLGCGTGKNLLFAAGGARCEIPEYVVVPVRSVAALDRVVPDAARLRAVLTDVGGGFASYMYVFTPRPEEDWADVDTYHAKLFNLATLEEEYPTGIEATLIIRHRWTWGRPFPTAPRWTVFHPGSTHNGRGGCVVSVFPDANGERSHFGGAAVTTDEGNIELRFSNLNERKSVDSGIGTETEVDAGPEVAELSSYLTSEHEGLHDPGYLECEDEWETASQTDLESLDALLAPY